MPLVAFKSSKRVEVKESGSRSTVKVYSSLSSYSGYINLLLFI